MCKLQVLGVSRNVQSRCSSCILHRDVSFRSSDGTNAKQRTTAFRLVCYVCTPQYPHNQSPLSSHHKRTIMHTQDTKQHASLHTATPTSTSSTHTEGNRTGTIATNFGLRLLDPHDIKLTTFAQHKCGTDTLDTQTVCVPLAWLVLR